MLVLIKLTEAESIPGLFLFAMTGSLVRVLLTRRPDLFLVQRFPLPLVRYVETSLSGTAKETLFLLLRDFGGASGSRARPVLHVVGAMMEAVLVDDSGADLLVTVFADCVDGIGRVSCRVVLSVLDVEAALVITASADVVGTGLVVAVLTDCVDGIGGVSRRVVPSASHVEAPHLRSQLAQNSWPQWWLYSLTYLQS